ICRALSIFDTFSWRCYMDRGSPNGYVPASKMERCSIIHGLHWIILTLGILQSRFSVVDGLYFISTPAFYVIFSGDLDFNYTIPGNVSLPHAFIRLELNKPNESPHIITALGLRLGRKTETLRVTCGVIEFAGKYTLKMYTRVNGDVLTQSDLDVRWPEVTMSLPDTHEAQTQSVELRVLSKANCSSLLHRHYLSIHLYFQRSAPRDSVLDLSQAQIVHSVNFTQVNKTYSALKLGCHLFDLDGYYQAVLVSSASNAPVVSYSNIMYATWSEGYVLGSRSSSAFPCEGALTLFYAHPPCSGMDKIRLHSYQLMSQGSLASPLERTYVTEMVAHPDLSKVTFDCGLFNQTSSGFCFTYVSVTRATVVTEQKHFCIPAYPNSVFPIDGGWSQWTTWTSCSVTCGSGRKSRFRICNEPTPKHGGRFCSGDPVEWMPCEVHCPDAIPRTPLHSPRFDPNCSCGCIKTHPKDQIIATGRCHGFSVWILKSEPGFYFTLKFDYFSLNFTRQWVRIRDGESPSDILLFSSSTTGYPLEIISSGPAMRVEFMTIFAKPTTVTTFSTVATLPIHVHGFIATYSVEATLLTSTVPALFQYEKETIMGNIITIVGISVCVVVVVVAFIFVIIQRTIIRRRIKYSVAMSVDSPVHHHPSDHQVSSGVSSSPSSPAINVGMDVPLTNKHKQSNGGKTSRASSTSSSKSSKLKPAKVKNEGTSPADVLTSPYGIEIIDIDEQSDVRNNSPVRGKVLKAASASACHKNAPVSPLSPVTKLDMLNKKRLEKRGTGVNANMDRDITGSSGSQKSGTPSTTKAEVNWPQHEFAKSTLVDSIRTSSDRHKRSGVRPPSEEIPLLDSMTSSLESPSHFNFNNMVKSESTESATTSFVRPLPPKVRRPTSLTESYSSDSKSKAEPEAATAAVISTLTEGLPPQEPDSKSRQLPTVVAPLTTTKTKTHPSSVSSSTAPTRQRRQVRQSPSQSSLSSNKSSTILKRSAFEERQTLLPKPDGQSPKLQRHESPNIKSMNGHDIKDISSPSRASRASSKNTVSSPTRSINTPSETEGLELEYDDFVEDDPLSYFDYEETQKLAFRGTEKIGRTPVEEEDEDEV
ncbi:hypothetical protein BgiMline_022392, partial [Biomphalaria glabrata]